MFFIWVGTAIAWFAVIAGALKFGVSGLIGFIVDTDEQRIAFARRYFGEADTGAAIAQGEQLFVVGIVIGLLVRIAKNAKSE